MIKYILLNIINIIGKGKAKEEEEINIKNIK